MTANKSFKKLVRQRMRQTGLSYAAARQALRRQPGRPRPMVTRDELHEEMAIMQTAIREFLSPIAKEYDKPLDPGLVSAIMFERVATEGGEGRRWRVDLYTLSPGLVIGREGKMADALRRELCRLTGDTELWINIVNFEKVHAAVKSGAYP